MVDDHFFDVIFVLDEEGVIVTDGLVIGIDIRLGSAGTQHRAAGSPGVIFMTA